MLVLFVVSIFVLTGITAIVVDISWYWANTLRVQRAADAAALAGVVWLPGDPSKAYQVARDEATKNGYTASPGGVTVTPLQDATNKRRLNVTISAPVDTYFMRIFGIQSITAMRTSKAEYVLPVPMGSPQDYYGVGFLRDAVSTTRTTIGPQQDTGWQAPGNTITGSWQSPWNADDQNDNRYATSTTTNAVQRWGNFGLLGGSRAIPTSARIDGLEVRLRAGLTGTSGTTTNCSLSIDTTWNGSQGSPSRSTAQTLPLSTSEAFIAFGSQTSTAIWGSHSWVRNDFSDADFQVRITNLRGAGCNRTAAVDTLEVRVTYHTVTTSTVTDIEDVDVVGPQGQLLAPQNFWGAMQSQGAPNIQGDAYMTKYESRSGLPPNNVDNTDPDAQYLPDSYYNYAIEMPAGATGGSVWIFDPGFCDATSSAGTGENWTVGNPNGYGSRQPASAFYDLFDTKNTLYDPTDDSPVASTGSTFRRLSYEDRDVFVALGQSPSSGIGDCSNLSWHYDANDWMGGSPSNPRRGWYQLASGLTGGPRGTTYRLHTYSTDPDSPSDQNNTTALNAFAIYASAAGGTPRVYGIGAMEAYVRLPAGRASEFYLAQIDAVHAGKTMVINLWDPGDTGQLSANLQILQPGATDYTPATFSYHATRGTSDGNASSCSSATVSGATSVTTNTGGNSRYNGCWLTIEIQLPPTYSAPHPSSDTTTSEKGWWKIRYTMGAGSGYSTDLTTWQVDIRGNPVHLLVP
jgi:hypothetical protein